MENEGSVDLETLEGGRRAASYPPSWVDRFQKWVDHLSGPWWMFYAGLWLVLYLIEIATQWTAGAITLKPFHIVLVGTIAYNLALIHYLDRTAEAALNKFRAVLDCSDAEYADLLYQLTTLPARPVLIVALIGVIWVILLAIAWPLEVKLRLLQLIDSPASNYYNHAITIVVWSCVAIFIYHTLHQLVVVRQIYRRSRVNLFNLGPLYAFSDLSARTTIGALVILYAWFATAPAFSSEPAAVSSGVLTLAVTILTFIWPLVDVHNLLVEEKTRLLNETSQQSGATIVELHERINSKQVQGMDDLNKAMTSLEIEFGAPNRISTWPWRSETLRWFIATLLFPVIVWLTQWALQRILSMG